MPAIQEGSLVLVTGASGFIAAHLCSTLLCNGHKVRGTVRSKEKGEYLKNLFKGVGQFEYVIVEDIADPNAFDEAVKGVEGIAHTASPFYLDAQTHDELLKPAIEGTVNVMRSALKNNPHLKRLVITSSVAAVVDPNPRGEQHANGPPYTMDERDWNEYSPKVVEEKGVDAPGSDKYRASKTLAERAAWKFMEENKPSWDFATINPPLVFGPIIHQVDSPENLNTSVANFWSYIEGKKTDDDLKESSGNWVDVRDVALAHYKALTVPAAGGNRFITSNGPFNGQDVVDIIHAFPGPALDKVPRGKPGTGKEINAKANVFSGEKAHKVLGIDYTELMVCLEDMYKSLQEKFDESHVKDHRTA
ncbi:hypothetical protein NliqN6_2348 [Naganishia liquefaciens]|uniref:3-beta hydroxysteroid dehydrogenase/isomerase domain-containing protein n=1 Tax=Naganishia liquefaciens TaxID=104408 RepID=A0A8H3YFQ2_9TREE|nr:hypothetical protein NliqN6_2348 [Naganishia liquefaciens]